MERHLDLEIGSLRKNLLQMSGMVEYDIDKTIRALKERNADLAREVIEDDKTIDRLEIEIENQCFNILARHQPVAVDLRFIMASVKINNDLERMGDLAVNIAQKTLSLIKLKPLKPLIDIPYMAQIVQGMVKDSLDSFLENDIVKAKAVCENDDVVDALEEQIVRELTTYMIENPKNISQALDLTLVARHLERLADLTTNIGEEVIFIVQAKNIKHHSEDLDAQRDTK